MLVSRSLYRAHNCGGIAADSGTVIVQHGAFMLEGFNGEAAREIPDIGIFCHHAQCQLFAAAADDEGRKGTVMIDYSEYLEGYQDAQAYDVEEGGYDADYPLTLALARELGGPLLDLACGTGTMAMRILAT